MDAAERSSALAGAGRPVPELEDGNAGPVHQHGRSGWPFARRFPRQSRRHRSSRRFRSRRCLSPEELPPSGTTDSCPGLTAPACRTGGHCCSVPTSTRRRGCPDRAGAAPAREQAAAASGCRGGATAAAAECDPPSHRCRVATADPASIYTIDRLSTRHGPQHVGSAPSASASERVAMGWPAEGRQVDERCTARRLSTACHACPAPRRRIRRHSSAHGDGARHSARPAAPPRVGEDAQSSGLYRVRFRSVVPRGDRQACRRDHLAAAHATPSGEADRRLSSPHRSRRSRPSSRSVR